MVETISVRIRLVIYETLPHKPGEYAYYVSDYTDVGPNTHTVWLTANVPVKPTPIEAKVEE